MPVIINGTTGLSGVSTVNLANGSVTQNILANGVAGTGPAFSAYPTTPQAISATTFTKIIFGAEDFDTNNNFASSRFTPTVAGYYQMNWCVAADATQARLLSELWKNGSAYLRATDVTSALTYNASGAGLVYCNGTTDYLEVYAFFQTSANASVNGRLSTYFNGSLARAA